MWFTDSETRQRHEFIDASIESTANLLDTDVMRSTLGRLSVENALWISRNLVVPNVKHGQVSLKVTSGDNKLPILTLKPGEVVSVEPRAMTPSTTQLLSAADKARGWLAKGGITNPERHLLDKASPSEGMNLRYLPSSAAYVVSREEGFRLPDGNGKNNVRYLRSRPYTVLQIKDDAEPRKNPSVMLHEYTHIEQGVLSSLVRYDSPDDRADELYRRELEAYHRQLFFIRGMVALGYTALEGETSFHTVTAEGTRSAAYHIDTVRRETNAKRKDKFYPNGTLKKKLSEAGLDIVI